MTIELPLIEVFGRGGALKSSWYGDCLPSRDFPMLIDLYLQGRFDLDAFVSETIGLGDVEAAFEKMHHGEVLRSRRGLLMAARIDKVVVSGVFSLDGQDFDVDNNVWLVGDDDEVLVIDAPHDAAPIVEAIGGRRVTAIVLTHGHNDHITAAVALREATGAPIWFNPADRMLWDVVHPGTAPDHDLTDGTRFDGRRDDARRAAHARVTRRAAPASTRADLGTVFTGDTLFCGGPGATGRSYSDHPTIVALDPRRGCSRLPGDTVVRTGHGDDTTIAAERSNIA